MIKYSKKFLFFPVKYQYSFLGMGNGQELEGEMLYLIKRDERGKIERKSKLKKFENLETAKASRF